MTTNKGDNASFLNTIKVCCKYTKHYKLWSYATPNLMKTDSGKAAGSKESGELGQMLAHSPCCVFSPIPRISFWT